MQNLIEERMEELFSVLNDRERKILELRFGHPKKTLKEVGEIFGVQGERIRCIQNVAERKIRRRMDILRNRQKLGLLDVKI